MTRFRLLSSLVFSTIVAVTLELLGYPGVSVMVMAMCTVAFADGFRPRRMLVMMLVAFIASWVGFMVREDMGALAGNATGLLIALVAVLLATQPWRTTAAAHAPSIH